MSCDDGRNKAYAAPGDPPHSRRRHHAAESDAESRFWQSGERGRAASRRPPPAAFRYRRRRVPRTADKAAGSDLSSARRKASPDGAPREPGAAATHGAAGRGGIGCTHARRVGAAGRGGGAIGAGAGLAAQRGHGARVSAQRSASPPLPACAPGPCARQVSAPLASALPSCGQKFSLPLSCARSPASPEPISSRQFCVRSCAPRARSRVRSCARCARPSSPSCEDWPSCSLCVSSHSFS